jgi:predicted TPR repeat methyltransferase
MRPRDRDCENGSNPTVAHEALNWQFDELGYAGAEHLDADYVEAYDTKSPTDWSEDVATLLALGVGATSTVVDLGAGTGTFGGAIAPHVARVVAVDVSAIASWLAAAPEDPRHGWTAAQLAEHVRNEHSTFTWLLEPMLEESV